MGLEGQYVYCIIGTGEARNFGPIGIGDRGDPVTTFAYRDLSAVVSTVSTTKYVVSKETMIAHEKVIERVMREYTVLPVRFYTVAPSAEDIRNVLRARYGELKKLLREMDNKVELGIKAWWKNMAGILGELRQENKDIQRLEEQARPDSAEQRYQHEEDLARAIRVALDEKRAREREVLLAPLKRVAGELCLNQTYDPEMIINAAFLVDRGREGEFDAEVRGLEAKCGDRMEFRYVGPAPPFNFVNIEVKELSA
ncbi:MAG: GvpL/GvpF family gas vesicle protein [Chloroflexi bacterium]|nr:GvpL/GvpF family gas vesicle protein [Chloroflexota bacterium]